jgi:hypothetical protein
MVLAHNGTYISSLSKYSGRMLELMSYGTSTLDRKKNSTKKSKVIRSFKAQEKRSQCT